MVEDQKTPWLLSLSLLGNQAEIMIIQLNHPQTTVQKTAKVGFSWTSLFFGFLVPLVRGDMKWMAIQLVVVTLTFGLAYFVVPFVYNKIYIRELLEKGYTPISEEDRDILVAKNFLVASAFDDA